MALYCRPRLKRLSAATVRCCRTIMVSDKATPVVVVKSPSDKREYEFLRLRNGLSALLIHDPEIKPVDDLSELESEDESVDDEDESEEDESEDEGKPKAKEIKKAAAALCVNVGSFSDPKDAEGLAHFLEHMLFMGSSKFPDENEYDSFLSKHGGLSNAFTEMEYTVYHFSVHHSHLKPALDRFSQFFVSPLIKMDSLEREVQAVDSEFVQSLQNDSCRLDQLKCSTADPSHPYHRFSWGNQKSLTDAINKCGDIREKLFAFYKQHYLAERMKLVVYGGEPLETLRGWVSELFKDVPKGGGGMAPRFESEQRPWPARKLYRVESVKDQQRLVLSWPIPCLDHEYLKKSHDYLSHLIGHEGAGSLLKLLKEKNWALEMTAGVGEDGLERSSAGYVFVVDITLTLLGLDNIFDIIDHVYEYLKMLQERRPQEWVFEEIRAITATDFRFLEEEESDDYAARLSKNMHVFPPHHTIYGDYAYEMWDAGRIETLLDHFNPENMRVDIVSKSFDSNAASGLLTEPWFGVPYTVEEIPEHLHGRWSNPLPNTAFHLPPENDFICRDFGIKHSPEEQAALPYIISEEPSMKVWYKLDQTFLLPRASVFVAISCNTDSARSLVLTQLYILLLRDAANEIRYMASVASLNSVINGNMYRLEIKAFGYNEKLKVLMQRIAELLKTFVAKEDRFEVMKEQLGQSYRNANLKPLSHSSNLRLELLEEPYWSFDTRLRILESLVVADVNNFLPQLFEQVHLEALCHGNLSKEEALDISNVIKSAVMANPMPEHIKPRKKMVKLPVDKSLVYNVCVVNELEENSVAEIYFETEQQCGLKTLRDMALNDLFEHVINEPFFNQLRTTEQLGYIVESSTRLTNGVHGFCFRIQSSKYNPDYLHKRIEAFIDRCSTLLKDMPDEVFQNFKSSLIAAKLEKLTNLMDETDRYWWQILDERYLFDEQKRVAAVLQDVTQEELTDWYRDYLPAGAPKRRTLGVHVWGCNFKDDMHKEHQYVSIENIRAFKDGAEFYPPVERPIL